MLHFILHIFSVSIVVVVVVVLLEKNKIDKPLLPKVVHLVVK